METPSCPVCHTHQDTDPAGLIVAHTAIDMTLLVPKPCVGAGQPPTTKSPPKKPTDGRR